ncbi:MAG: SDR family oxidoreductase, partial [Eudoraea sp.]|uniref:SDR family NAD(P)-dependent oxidoreductase n=1 Tax=Eudoraea sp. TaxID=1979955 RepID=UPI003C7464F1
MYQSKPEDNKRLIAEAVDTFGKIDVLFVNAGVAYFTPAETEDEDHFDAQFNTNIKGPA